LTDSAKSPGASVELRSIVRTFDGVQAVRNVSLTVNAEEFMTLLGPSGSGKTTSLMCVAGFETPDEGDIFIGGTRVTYVPSYMRELGFVFQNYALFPHMTVFENVAFPLRLRRGRSREIARRVDEVLEKVRLDGYGNRYPNQLSGGQQQRVALARALVFNPPVLLMDEPLGALDKKLREQMQIEIKHIQKDLRITVIYVTHDQEEALTMSDRIAVMDQGVIVQCGDPEEIYERPTNEFVANFIGETNLFKGRSSAGCVVTSSGLAMRLPEGSKGVDGGAVHVALRPERVVMARPDTNGSGNPELFAGVIEEVIYVGDARKYRVRLKESGDIVIAKQVPERTREVFCASDPVQVGWEPSDLRVIA